MWLLTVVYKNALYFRHLVTSPLHPDKVISKKLRKRDIGSGMDLSGKGRDIIFSYRTEKTARAGERKAKKIAGVIDTYVEKMGK